VESPFEILDIEPDADEDAIERAYRARVKEVHPDHGGSVEAFQSVRAAYEEALSEQWDSETRAGYADGPDTGDSETDQPEPPIHPRVDYLNYEVLDDHGWNVDDAALFETAAGAGLDEEDFGSFHVLSRESVLEAAERNDFAWPFACRGGACANCAVVVLEGELTTRVDHVLPSEMVERGFQLSCNGIPTTDELKILYNVKHMPDLEDLLLPPRPFEQAHSDD